MAKKFAEHNGFDLSQINKDILEKWQQENTFEQSIQSRQGKPEFVFYEGPPSANGLPGIHHVIARTIKDTFCRFKTLQGYQVKRKAGWDTHGLPVELAVEKKLGITKEAIGKTITVEEYNKTCRKEVMKYTDIWKDITEKMGYWVNMDDPYITYDSKYIETLWYLLKELYNKKLLYKGYSIQPYSPAAGTGLSSHELNLPGCYKDVKDTTAIAQFKAIRNEQSEFLFADTQTDIFFLAWTTTPWTLLSNTALAVGKKIVYQKIQTFNPYTFAPVTLILAKDLAGKYFSSKNADLQLEDYQEGDKKIPFRVLTEYKGEQLEGLRYEQLMPYQQPETGDAFRVLIGDFVSTEDGTGIVHLAPSFGADDYRVCQQNGIGALTLVDKQGKFVEGVGEFSGKFVKNSFDKNLTDKDQTTDVQIVIKLKKENKAFRVEKYEHSYPHCWRTDKPVLYYPLDSWFVRTTAVKPRMMELNKTINWQPEATGTGRFGKWLENLVDWNLSRSRFWGTPLPIWRSEDGSEEICIGSIAELKQEAQKAVEAGFMDKNPLEDFVVGDFSQENYASIDLHRPYVDDIFLVSATGKKMIREADLIDVWFDSGAMPFAQLHYPFENKKLFKASFPADFISEGVDQTRGWFFTLHAIATMIEDSVAFKNILSTGLVLDDKGNKMSKSKGNVIDPFMAIDKYGSDAIRWYMLTNANPWDNLKFALEGVDEVKRKFFGTLYNTYSFFALYANVDNFHFEEAYIPIEKRPEIDRWVISLLHSLTIEVKEHLENYDPTKAGRAIQYFVIENLSNWYVRLNRKRFWGGDYSEHKISAYQTLYECLETVSILSSPIAPFFTEQLYRDLTDVTGRSKFDSIHLTDFPTANTAVIDKELEERMAIAQKLSSMILSLRRKESLKVRQPLNKIMVPIIDTKLKDQIEAVKSIILSEVNIKEIEYITDASGVLVKKIKANFKTLGRRFGKQMKQVAGLIAKLDQQQISQFEANEQFELEVDGQKHSITLADVEIVSEDIPGWLVANQGKLTVALDVTVSEELREEGIARELINRIQNFRKESGLAVTDKIRLKIQKHDAINTAINKHNSYIASQTLSNNIELIDELDHKQSDTKFVEIDEIKTYMQINAE